MWKDLWQRLSVEDGEASPQDRREALATAIEAARARREDLAPLFAQLEFAWRMANSQEPIDRATVPLHLAFGRDKAKELAAQIKLSPYLRTNLHALLQHFREDDRALGNAERALKLAQEEAGHTISTGAALSVYGLFNFLSSTRERFRDYPLVYQLLGGMAVATSALRPEVPEGLEFYLESAPTTEHVLTDEDLEAFKEPGAVLKALGVAPITLEVGLDLVPLIDPALGGDLMSQLVPLRHRVALELGFVMPGLSIVDNLSLRPNCYQLRVRGSVVDRGELLVGYSLAIETEKANTDQELVGFPSVFPVTGQRACWVAGSEAHRAAKEGYEVISPAGTLLRHLEAVVRHQAHEILALEEVHIMLETLRAGAPTTVAAVIPDKLELADYHQVLKRLLMEGVSIRDQRTILEALAHAARPLDPMQLARSLGPRPSMEALMAMDVAARGRPPVDPQRLTEQVRVALSRQICAQFADENAVIDVVVLDGQVEEAIAEAIQITPNGERLALPPNRRNAIVDGLTSECQRLERPVVLCAPGIRPFVKALSLRALPRLAVLSYDEIHPAYRVQSIGTVSLVG
ncbi:MAG TPA: FHIPEP family type III secretion protein [Oscillatoriaceae cyanobacterium]